VKCSSLHHFGAAVNAGASSPHIPGAFCSPHCLSVQSSQSLTLSSHRQILIRLLSQTTLPALNIPGQRQQEHTCKRFHDFSFEWDAGGQCAYVSRHCCAHATCSGR
jgi:hypothetical protein